jgi:UDP-N-acetylmuramoyl-L-alanyl-D-glutamate--2,6-diaminopimelate ligase
MSSHHYISTQELAQVVNIREIRGDFRHVDIESITNDSRKADERTVFVCIKGTQADGHDYIQDAINQGCKIIIVEEFKKIGSSDDCTYIRVSNTLNAYSRLSSALYGWPEQKLNIIGVTGTNGKTTIATLLYTLFNNMGYKAGLISTIDVRTPVRILGSDLTTPDAGALRKFMAQMVEDECSYVFMEVSSHALDQNRVIGLDFKLAIFTNITRDHLDYHGSFKAYLNAKKLLFDNLGPNSTALINNDSKHAKYLVQNCKAQVCYYGVKSMAKFKGKIIEQDVSGMELNFDGQSFFSPLSGAFNAENLLAVYASAKLLGLENEDLLRQLSALKSVRGRMEVVQSVKLGLKAIVDYAHTPDALEKLYAAVKETVLDGKMICILGCGGDRDRGKRPEMAKKACQFCDTIIFTNDNPRTENPEHIIEDMMMGVSKGCSDNLLTIVDRKQAIKTACRLATSKDVLIIAGKGHETYQEIKGIRLPFDDKLQVQEEFKRMETIK